MFIIYLIKTEHIHLLANCCENKCNFSNYVFLALYSPFIHLRTYYFKALCNFCFALFFFFEKNRNKLKIWNKSLHCGGCYEVLKRKRKKYCSIPRFAQCKKYSKTYEKTIRLNSSSYCLISFTYVFRRPSIAYCPQNVCLSFDWVCLFQIYIIYFRINMEIG